MRTLRPLSLLCAVLILLFCGCQSSAAIQTSDLPVPDPVPSSGTPSTDILFTEEDSSSDRHSAMEITAEMRSRFDFGELDVEDSELPPVTVTLSAVGDIMAHTDTFESARTSDGFDFDYMVEEVAQYVKDSDFVIGNLETTLAGKDRTYTGYPDFNTPEQIMDSMVNILGMDLVSTANNHSLDRGFSGLCKTLDNLDSRGVYHVGTNRSQEEYDTPLIVTINNVKFAFLNYTYGLNNPNGIKYKYSVNVTSRDAIKKMAEKAADAGAEYIIALMHWGTEYARTPSSSQTELAEWIFANTDVRLIIGTHPHVVQPIEELTVERNGEKKTGIVLYSLGNFTGSQVKSYTNTGMLATITLKLSEENKNTSAVESIDCRMLYIDPNTIKNSGYRVIAMEDGIRNYENKTDSLISAKDYQKMCDYMSEYHKQLETLPVITVH